jgi:hypothetical protein
MHPGACGRKPESPREQRPRDGGNTPRDKALYAEKSLEVRATKDEEARPTVNWGVTSR